MRFASVVQETLAGFCVKSRRFFREGEATDQEPLVLSPQEFTFFGREDSLREIHEAFKTRCRELLEDLATLGSERRVRFDYSKQLPPKLTPSAMLKMLERTHSLTY